jgi:hypothetical protein
MVLVKLEETCKSCDCCIEMVPKDLCAEDVPKARAQANTWKDLHNSYGYNAEI